MSQRVSFRYIKIICLYCILVHVILFTGCVNKESASSISFDQEIESDLFVQDTTNTPVSDVSPPPEEGSSSSLSINEESPTQCVSTPYEINRKRDILCLMMAYPKAIQAIERKAENKVMLVLAAGGSILYDDFKPKGFEAKIVNADLQDAMEQIYPLTSLQKLLPEGTDPGRFRVYALLNALYGASRQQRQSNIQSVSTQCGSFQFNKAYGSVVSFKAAMDEVARLLKNGNNISPFVFPIGGTYNERFIAGTQLLSAHAYGIAVDLAVNKKDYWKWAKREEGEQRLAKYPQCITQAFEKQGFIWGGKWGHFDIMHYEYRPELILKAKYFKEEVSKDSDWFGELPIEGEIEGYIQMIDEALM